MKILFLNHKEKNCGVYQYGYRVYNIIKKSNIHTYLYYEIENEDEYIKSIQKENPDGIIYNYHPWMMGWLNVENMSKFTNIKHYKLCHEDLNDIRFDYFINDIYDRGNLAYYTPRPIFETNFPYENNDIPIIGSFGFGYSDCKGFERLCRMVNDQFDEAIIKLNITYSFACDLNGEKARSIADRCRNSITKEKIKLEIDHEFKNDEELLKFLSQNSLNAFLYSELDSRGFSSVIDYAISVNRPIAITKSNMFRHIYDIEPSICVENNSLKEIIENGSKLLNIYKKSWSNHNLIKSYDDMITQTFEQDIKIYNKILNNEEREYYKNSISRLKILCPETIKTKYSEANVQQAFVLETTEKLGSIDSEILGVGSYSDTSVESLIKLGYDVTEIDPIINYDLHSYHMMNIDKKFDIIVSTSVMEHVDNDELFIEDICKMLKEGGYGILTCDFKDDYKIGDRLPNTNIRFYTKEDLNHRLKNILLSNDCDIYNETNYESMPDFNYDDCQYSFATYVFKKKVKKLNDIIFDFSYNKNENRIYIKSYSNFTGIVHLFRGEELLYYTEINFDGNSFWFQPFRDMSEINDMKILINDINGNIIKEKYINLRRKKYQQFSEIKKQSEIKVGIFVVNTIGFGDSISISPLLRKMYYIFGGKITLFGHSHYSEFFRNNPYVEHFYIQGTYNPDEFKDYKIYNIFDNWNSYYYYDFRQLCASSLNLFLKEDEMEYDYFPEKFVEISDLPKKYVVVNPYTSGPDRNWDKNQWQELIEKLNDDGIYVVTIGKGDKEKNGPYHNLKIRLGVNLCGDKRQNNLSQTWHIIEKSDMFISFDCGIYIFAGTTSTKIVQLGWYADHYLHAPIRNGKRFENYSCVRGDCDVYCLTDPRFDVLAHGNIETRHEVWTCPLNKNFVCKPQVENVYLEIKNKLKN